MPPPCPKAPRDRLLRRGQTVERVVFFTDAVFAIAMTLLVIEIPRPDSADFAIGSGVSKATAAANLWRFLRAQDGSFFAYLLAFYLLWIVWREHHALFDQVSQLSGPMIGLHFPLLLLVAFLPYPTTIVGHYLDNPVARRCCSRSRSAACCRRLAAPEPPH